MKLSSDTLEILKNFSTINQSMKFRPGKTLATVGPQKSIFGLGEISDKFPVEFSIYDLNKLLGVLSLHGSDAEIDFGSKDLTVSSKIGKTTYRYTDPRMFVSPPDDKELKLPSEDIHFSLSEETLDSLMKVSGTLGSPNIVVHSKGDKIKITTTDLLKDDSDTHTFEVGKGNGAKYNMIFSTANIKILPGAYDVDISEKGIARFTNQARKLVYFMTADTGSKYGG